MELPLDMVSKHAFWYPYICRTIETNTNRLCLFEPKDKINEKNDNLKFRQVICFLCTLFRSGLWVIIMLTFSYLRNIFSRPLQQFDILDFEKTQSLLF